MSTSKRPPVRRSSLAGTSPVQPPSEAPPAPAKAAPQKQDLPKPAPEASQPRRVPRTAPAGAMVRVGVYLTPEAFTAAKAGYLGAWQLGGDADSFSRWIAAAISEHSSATAEQRATHAEVTQRADTRSGSTRSFDIPADVATRMRQAITVDQSHGRWLTASAWMGEAIAAAVERTRQASGGTLPTPPPRLPNRLTR